MDLRHNIDRKQTRSNPFLYDFCAFTEIKRKQHLRSVTHTTPAVFKGIGKAKCLKKLPQKPVVFSLVNLCTFLTMLSTYGYFLSGTIMF